MDKVEFAIIGAGRFGQFWGRHLSLYFPTFFWDVDLSKKADIERFANWLSLESCLTKKYIFLTLPINQIRGFLSQNRDKFQAGNVLIDCASVKKPVIEWFGQSIPEDIFYIASHPLFGPDSAETKLAGQQIVMIPGRVPLKEYGFMVHFLRHRLGLRVVNMTAKEHDELMAYNLNLVHYLGRVLNELGISRLSLTMNGLEKLNHIVDVVMNDNIELFYDFYRFNPYAQKMLAEWQAVLTRMEKQINDQVNQ